jgi:hypothetical protein
LSFQVSLPARSDTADVPPTDVGDCGGRGDSGLRMAIPSAVVTPLVLAVTIVGDRGKWDEDVVGMTVLAIFVQAAVVRSPTAPVEHE